MLKAEVLSILKTVCVCQCVCVHTQDETVLSKPYTSEPLIFIHVLLQCKYIQDIQIRERVMPVRLLHATEA